MGDLETPAFDQPTPTGDEPEPPAVEVIDVPLEATAAEELPRSVTDELLEGQQAAPPTAATPFRGPVALRRGRLIGPMGLGLLAGCLAVFIIGLGIAGVYQGLHIRTERQSREAEAHYELGLAHLQKGEYEAAAAEFEWALRLRPDFPEAEEKLTEARMGVSQQPSPSAPGAEGQSSSLLAEGRSAYDRGAWDLAIEKLEALQSLDPEYEQSAVRRLLAAAYANSGLKLINEERLEEAIRRFDQALTLEPDNPDVQLQRRLATLYLGGLTAWGMDWGQAIRNLVAAYALKPDYKDTAERLLRAYVQAGDAAGSASAWCDAVQYYKAALDLTSTPEVAAKRDDAAHRCASPTTVPGGTPVASGTFVGTFGGLEDIQFRTKSWAKVHGRVVNAQGEGLPNAQVQLSAFDWSSVHTTDATGYYGFEFLNNEITFTVGLVGLPSQPVDVPCRFGFAAIADFEEKR